MRREKPLSLERVKKLRGAVNWSMSPYSNIIETVLHQEKIIDQLVSAIIIILSKTLSCPSVEAGRGMTQEEAEQAYLSFLHAERVLQGLPKEVLNKFTKLPEQEPQAPGVG